MKPKRQIKLGAVLVLVAIIVAVIFVIFAAIRPFTQLEVVLLQLFTLASGLMGSFLLGKQSAESAAREIIKPYARPAFRRVLSLYMSLSRLARTIKSARLSSGSDDGRGPVLDKLKAIVTEQIATADDAMEDWRDIIPEDVEELQKRLRNVKRREG
ncbi:hypothetical protein KAX17_08675 [Candidatus Bipolaricaulota bacterium]|nr:hypothetical protein [Candidatus Bipolaricaulota bacterium]